MGLLRHRPAKFQARIAVEQRRKCAGALRRNRCGNVQQLVCLEKHEQLAALNGNSTSHLANTESAGQSHLVCVGVVGISAIVGLRTNCKRASIVAVERKG